MQVCVVVSFGVHLAPKIESKLQSVPGWDVTITKDAEAIHASVTVNDVGEEFVLMMARHFLDDIELVLLEVGVTPKRFRMDAALLDGDGIPC